MWNICRTCMSKEKTLISIFDQGKSPSINAMITAITSLEFSPNDTLPSKICLTCLDTIQITYYFKEQVLRCNNALQKQAQTSKLLVLQQVKEEKRDEDEYFYNEQNAYVSIIKDELSTEHVPSNVDDPQSNCSEREFVCTSNAVYDPSSETDVKPLNFELPLSMHEVRDDALTEEYSSHDIVDVNSHFDETYIKSEEVNVNGHVVQFGDNCEVTPPQVMTKYEVHDDEFSAEDDVPLTLLQESPDIYGKSQDFQQNSNKNHNTSCHSQSEQNDCNVNSKKRNCEIPRKDSKGSKKHKSEATAKLHKCEVCGKTFVKPSYLKMHMRGHTGERPFECEQCNARFTHIGNLKRHTRMHTGEAKPKPHKCEDCGKTFESISQLKIHIRWHTGERPFKCQYCNVMFTLAGDLTRHIRLHTGEATPKNHKCEDCGKTFEKPSRLQIHKRKHTGKITPQFPE